MPLGRGWTKLWDSRPSGPGPKLCLAEDEHQDDDAAAAAADDEADDENEKEDEDEGETTPSSPRQGSQIDTDTLLDPSHYPPRQAHLIAPYSRRINMAPAVVVPNPTGPPPSYINVSQVYLFQQQLQNQMIVTGTNPTREDNLRLQGVQWINEVRTALQL